MKKSFTRDEIIEVLNDCDHIDDAKMFFSEEKKKCPLFFSNQNNTTVFSVTLCDFCGEEKFVHRHCIG